MFCNQCEQTVGGVACESFGACGKDNIVAGMQDMLTHMLRGFALVVLKARKKGIYCQECELFAIKCLFATLTNVNFDAERFEKLIHELAQRRDELIKRASLDISNPLTKIMPAQNKNELEKQALATVLWNEASDPDILSLRQTLLYGLRGVAAYADHAAILGKFDSELYAGIFRALAAEADNEVRNLGDWLALVLECGNLNLRAMEILDAGHTETFGHPEPSEVSLGQRAGKAILVTGHDLCDLYALLKATEGLGINIYTHGEMLPAHGYPALKKFSHLAGHYGTAWQNQQKEMKDFPGSILFTTNCIQRPSASYKDNVFTTGLVGWPGVAHVVSPDFQAVIDRALALPGFEKDVAGAKILTGFGHNAVLGSAEAIIGAVKEGHIKHFFLVGGCDGAKPGRNYYTEFVEEAPKDTVILTLACGKFRIFDKDLGTIAGSSGLPRLLDIGQCNDAYSAIKIALALANAFNCEVNDLPLSLILSWYEQKAVAILLTLLALGIKNIRLGPSLPAFISPGVLEVLVNTYNIKPISTAKEDLKAIL